jgi:HlyD family secretion protein
VRIGQRARIKLTAFERTTPDIEGVVKFISPDLVESKSGAYYDVRLDVDQHPHGMNLTPGMPAEVFIETEKRTMLSYLLKPITEQMGRMFRER